MELGGNCSRLLLALIVLGEVAGTCHGFCRPSDESALLNLKQGFLDYGGRLQTWQADTDCCSWRGVSCAPDDRTVNGLTLDNLQVDQSKPDLWGLAIGNLTALTNLLLETMIIKGPIPLPFTDIATLQILDLESSSFTGSIPPQIGNLKNLTGFRLRDAPGMTGPIPKEFCNLTSLKFINIANVPLTGIPNCFRAPNLTTVSIQGTNISSPIPSTFGLAPLLQSIEISTNRFSGTIPDFFDGLSNLIFVDLSDNNLTGTIPASLFRLAPLETLRINDNRLHGPLPDLSKLTMLSFLEVTGNLLSGELPASLDTLTQLTEIMLDNNAFSGPLPPDFSNFCNLGFPRTCLISLTFNQLTGPIPPKFLNVSNYDFELDVYLQALFNISHNKLSGPIPQTIGPYLESLDASYNYLTGGFPLALATVNIVDLSNNKLNYAAQVGQLPGLYVHNPTPNFANPQAINDLNLANNRLRGPFPPWLLLFSGTIQRLDISSNYFWGPLPDAAYNFRNMELLNASHNFFSGTLPKHPFQNTLSRSFIVTLDLHHNHFSGSIAPSFFTSIRNAGGADILDFSQNRLSGPLPKEIGTVGADAVHLGLFPRRIDLSDNSFTGPIPPQIGNLVLLQYLDLSNNQFTGNVPASIANLMVSRILTYVDVRGNKLAFNDTLSCCDEF